MPTVARRRAQRVVVAEEHPVVAVSGHADGDTPDRRAGGGAKGVSSRRGAVGVVDDEVEGVAASAYPYPIHARSDASSSSIPRILATRTRSTS